MTTNSGPRTDQSPASVPPITPTARWRFQRTEEDGVPQLQVWTDTSAPVQAPVTLRMREDEARQFIHGCDRVVSLAAPAAQGTFTPVPDPDAVAAHLGVTRYRVVSPSVEAHVAMVMATAYANWMEQHTDGDAIRSMVCVFAGDSGGFLDVAQAHGAVVEPGDN